MNKIKLIKTVEDLGLSENEAQVYVSALALGPTSILKLANSAGMKRTTLYYVIESLKQKGLMFVQQQGWKKLFVAETPEKLQSIIDSRHKQLHQNLPDLLSLYNMKGQDALIKYYEGLEAVKSAYESMIRDIKAHEDYLIISDASKWLSLDREYFMDFSKRRAKLNINIKILLQRSDVTEEYLMRQKEMNSEVRLLPDGVNLSTNLVVIPRRALVHQMVPPIMAMAVENPNIILMYQEMFGVMWNSAKER